MTSAFIRSAEILSPESACSAGNTDARQRTTMDGNNLFVMEVSLSGIRRTQRLLALALFAGRQWMAKRCGEYSQHDRNFTHDFPLSSCTTDKRLCHDYDEAA